MTQNLAHIVVFGNEKGGCGKSTAAMHAAIALMRLGFTVGTIDLDARQGTLTRYLKNRFALGAGLNIDLPMPVHMPIMKSEATSLEDRKNEELSFFFMAVEELSKTCDIVIIDTPGTDSHLGTLATRYADTLVTPVNDSMIDLDLLADFDPYTMEPKGPSVYTRAVQAVNGDRKRDGLAPLRWIVMRNRINPMNLKSKRDIEQALTALSQQLGFTYLQGFSERVVFRDLFLKGLTVLDMDVATGKSLTMSQLAARQEVRMLVTTLIPHALKLRKMREVRQKAV